MPVKYNTGDPGIVAWCRDDEGGEYYCSNESIGIPYTVTSVYQYLAY